ncbi:hypothetical protein VA596_47250 [Amycolatopsis sp., V23-08]|uniref:Uncharacterized protein n=1 Tax=Amycolatopsis heterodermiae TaxID=3110235 RepID=A0ABU5RLP0_9PSEU|nr:hypothetical protein [Amycolatopsis sp., V23-08]MEA5367196.1 hypothetical protein [Amycolatopsis sp., V23-08]
MAVLQARQALAGLPEIRWRDNTSEQQGRMQLEEVAAIIGRALRRVRASSDEARALKYAQARLTAFLQGWGDPGLIATIHVVPMYQSLQAALRTLSLRLETAENADPPEEPDEPTPRS